MRTFFPGSFLNSSTLRGAGAAVALIATLVAAQAQAFPGGGRDGNPDARLQKMITHLELSEAQQASIREVMAGAREAGAADRKRMAAIKRELRELREQSTGLDPGKAQQLATELGEITARSAYLGTETRAAVHTLLDDDQRDKLETMQAQRSQYREQRKAGREQ